jgi:NADH-quinone oxidoreductase subunit L
VVGAGITAFYMTRLVLMTFFSNKRWEDDAHPHESPLTMTIPMILLAVGSLSSGFLLTRNHALEHWLEPVVGFEHADGPIPVPTLIGITLTTVLIGVLIAVAKYRNEVERVAPEDVTAFTKAARKDLYGDSINETVFMNNGLRVTRGTVIFDNSVVEGFTRLLNRVLGGVGLILRLRQTGYARSYALTMLAGSVFLLLALLIVRL